MTDSKTTKWFEHRKHDNLRLKEIEDNLQYGLSIEINHIKK